MSDTRLYDVTAFNDLKDGQLASFSVGGVAMVLVRDGDQVHALGGRCPHKGAPMEQGAYCRTKQGGVLVCPWHKAVFRAESGHLQEPVALDPLTRYPVVVTDGRVCVGTVPVPLPEEASRQPSESVLILGAGAAGVSAACALREQGFSGSITLVSEEEALPYDRTALSKVALLGDPGKMNVPLLRSEEFYAQHSITRVTGHIERFDPATRTATLSDGNTVRGDHVIIATGARPRLLDIPGATLKGAFTLRRQEDARKIIESLPPDRPVILIGGGFIGLEVASALRQKGAGVTVISGGGIPMEKQFGREIGNRLLQLHEENGVAFVTDAKAVRIHGKDHVEAVELDDGMVLPCALVLIGAGAVPETGFVTGLEKDKAGGIVVDDTLRVAPGVYVAGDAASIRRDGHAFRIEHWRHAQVQGRIAALSITGGTPEKMPTPWFWTQQFGKKIEYLGWSEAFDSVTLEGDLRSFNFLAVYTQQGRPVSLVGAGRAADMARAAVDFEGFLHERFGKEIT